MPSPRSRGERQEHPSLRHRSIVLPLAPKGMGWVDGAAAARNPLHSLVTGFWGPKGTPKREQGSSSLAAGRCSPSAEQKEIAVFFQWFGSSGALPGEWDGKRNQVSSGELVGGSSWALSSCSVACPRGKSSSCFTFHVSLGGKQAGESSPPGLMHCRAWLPGSRKSKWGAFISYTREQRSG